MKLIEKDKFNILEADEGKQLRNINDIYTPASIDENGNKIEEHYPYYFQKCYLPLSITLEKAMKLYIEETL